MPQLDRRTGDVVIRIVFDGPPEAGKTTTIDRLASLISLQRRSPVTRPGTTERRTEFFDWVDFSGGFLDGRRVRCQLLSVPGQAALLHRRRYLLDTADVVVFVADASSERLDEVQADFLTTQRLISRGDAAVPVGVVLQVNKQDLPNALSPASVAEALAVSPLVPSIGTSANEGVGIMQTLILAVRLATDRVRSLLLGDALDDVRAEDSRPEELYRTMLALEPAARASLVARSPPPPPAVPEPDDLRVVLGARRRTSQPDSTVPLLPQAVALPAGCIWPSVTGRAALAAANQGASIVSERVSDFAPPDAFEIETSNGWLFHSRPGWLFATESEARLALLALARVLAEANELLPEGRALLIGPDAEGWRLWMLTRRTPSLAEQVALAVEAGDGANLSQAWSALRDFSSGEASSSPFAVDVGLPDLALQRGRTVVLSLPNGLAPGGARAETPLLHLERVLGELALSPGAGSSAVLAARALLDGRNKSRAR